MRLNLVLRRVLVHAIAPALLMALLMALMVAGANAAEGGAAGAGAAAKAEDAVSSAGRNEDPRFRNYYRGSAPDTERYRRRTEMIEKESLEESLRLLSRAGMYHERMIMLSDVPQGFRGMEIVSILKILKNRRLAKVQGELRALPAGEAAVLINRELKSAMEDYRRELERQIGLIKEQSRWTGSSDLTGAPDLRAMVADDSYEGLEGKTLKVQALLLLAGEIGRADCATEIREVVAESIKLRDTVAAIGALGQSLNQYRGLLSPRIMTTALLRANHPEMTMEEAAKPFGLYSRNQVSDESRPGIFWIVEEMREESFSKVLGECLPGVEYRFELPEGNAWR